MEGRAAYMPCSDAYSESCNQAPLFADPHQLAKGKGYEMKVVYFGGSE